jgi:hypothetical protein
LQDRVQSYTATEKQEITPPDHPAAPPKMSIVDFGSSYPIEKVATHSKQQTTRKLSK